MFFFKSLFTRLYFLCAPIIAFVSLWQLVQGRWLWLGPLLAWLPLWAMNLWRLQKANLAFRDARESPALMAALLGVSILLVWGERGAILWITLAGLMALLLYSVVLTSVTRGVREPESDVSSLPVISFRDHSSQSCSLQSHGPALVVFVHSAWSPTARMQYRELSELVAKASFPVVAVFPDEIPQWASRSDNHLVCWSLNQQEDISLLLRGGGVGFSGEALRPALAVYDGKTVALWKEAENYRLPPSIQDNLPRIEKLIGQTV